MVRQSASIGIGPENQGDIDPPSRRIGLVSITGFMAEQMSGDGPRRLCLLILCSFVNLKLEYNLFCRIAFLLIAAYGFSPLLYEPEIKIIEKLRRVAGDNGLLPHHNRMAKQSTLIDSNSQTLILYPDRSSSATSHGQTNYQTFFFSFGVYFDCRTCSATLSLPPSSPAHTNINIWQLLLPCGMPRILPTMTVSGAPCVCECGRVHAATVARVEHMDAGCATALPKSVHKSSPGWVVRSFVRPPHTANIRVYIGEDVSSRYVCD